MQKAGRVENVTRDGLKVDGGGNGEPSVLDDQPSSSPTHPNPERSSCGDTDLRTDQSGDHKPTTSQIFAAVDSACGEPALQGVGRDEGLCDDSKMMEDQTVVEDASTLCADISSGVTYMDIDVGKETGDSAVSPGTMDIF